MNHKRGLILLIKLTNISDLVLIGCKSAQKSFASTERIHNGQQEDFCQIHSNGIPTAIDEYLHLVKG